MRKKYENITKEKSQPPSNEKMFVFKIKSRDMNLQHYDYEIWFDHFVKNNEHNTINVLKYEFLFNNNNRGFEMLSFLSFRRIHVPRFMLIF